ncbi:cob(I)yrinic acid a,c-diamide adenosyltransferase [candidate division KSB1 bacterium]|nr:cob(I)yrinic acid a,c-diamide adenosyltransferase [candidate division KSB1 bacterium]MBL7093888.1 cob(I)yrinic acid a,c-diamide adenosyltransferase [candidate division KSB1 bacterium]
MEKGYIQIYTGDGKGKTTAALGLALRAAGRGFRTYIAQFMKGQSYGELKSIRLIPEIEIEQFGKNTFIHVDQAAPQDIQMAKNGLKKAKEKMLSGEFNIIILDEINMAIHFKLLPIADVVDFIAVKPGEVELVLTGRRAPDELIQSADLVTEMREIKHYYAQGVTARDGIER